MTYFFFIVFTSIMKKCVQNVQPLNNSPIHKLQVGIYQCTRNIRHSATMLKNANDTSVSSCFNNNLLICDIQLSKFKNEFMKYNSKTRYKPPKTYTKVCPDKKPINHRQKCQIPWSPAVCLQDDN